MPQQSDAPTIATKNPALLFQGIENRVALAKNDGDSAFFHDLSLELECLTKLVTCGVLACVGDDADRHRYSVEHKLVRADSIGDWVNALRDLLIGPAAQFIETDARILQTQLAQRVGPEDWRHSAVTEIKEAAAAVGVDQQLGRKAALRQFFELGAQLRNRSRAHGATTLSQCSRAAPHLRAALDNIVDNLDLFRVPWAYLHRNLSGKYCVSPLVGAPSGFDYLKRTTEEQLSDGVYLYLDRPVRVPLVFTDPEVRDIFLPNGNHNKDRFEVISYVTNSCHRESGTAWSSPPGTLPRSETEGSTQLEPFGRAFANVPPKRSDYVSRPDLEGRLNDELLTPDRHPIVSLTGPGGIGKTSVAIAALHAIKDLDHLPYEAILWISARDVDLLESGPKPVSPRVVTQENIAHAAVDLLEPTERLADTFDSVTYFQRCLTSGALGKTLFVLDNFETVQSPADVFGWIDTHIRLPNKVLITTRIRDFLGHYPIYIAGMTDEQEGILVDQQAKRLSVGALVTSAYRNELIDESEGHPYVIRILLGQVAKERRAVKPERIVASSDHVLRALFERTYAALTPGSQRVFLLLCSWRVLVPEVAIEAVLLRPGNQRFDVAGAIDELERYSLVDRFVSTEEGADSLSVPLAAALYGRAKLEASPFGVSVEEDRRILMEFGPGKPKERRQSVLPRIKALYQSVARRTQTRPEAFEDLRPVLEYLAMRVPKAYLQLADLVGEVDGPLQSFEAAKEYVRRFLETAATPDKYDAWLQLADLCESSNDIRGEIHALSEAAIITTSNPDDLGMLANRLNNRIRAFKEQSIDDAWSQEVLAHLDRVTRTMEKHLNGMSGTDCSRLAWLYLNIGNSERAREVAMIGNSRDRENEHCLRLLQRLDA